MITFTLPVWATVIVLVAFGVSVLVGLGCFTWLVRRWRSER